MVELLVVDDEQQIREGIARGIPWERYGVSVCGTAASGTEALGLLDQLLPDILVLDIRMPDMDGLELLEILRERYPTVRAIIVSGHEDFTYAQRAVALHAIAYLLKPVDENELVAKVLEARDLVERRLAEVEADEDLRGRFREALPALRCALLAEVAAGRLGEEADTRKRAAFLGAPLVGSHCLALQLAVEPPARPGRSAADGSFAAFALASRAESLLRAVHPSSHAFSHGDGTAAIVFADAPDRPALLGACRQLKAWSNASLGIGLSVGVGRTHRGLAGASVSLREALEALEHRITMGRNEVIDAAALGAAGTALLARRGFEQLLRRLDEEALEAVRAGDQAGLERIAAEAAAGFVAHAEADIGRKDRFVFLLAFFLSRLRYELDLAGEPLDACAGFADALAGPLTATELRQYIGDEFARLATARAREQAGANGFLARRAREIVEADLYGDCSLSAVAAKLSVHPSHLSRVCKQETGASFLEFVIGARMREAKRLLKGSNRRVHEIAEALGYRDVNHFTRVFRRVVGVTPSDYRQLAP